MDINKYFSEFYKGTKNPSLDGIKYFMEKLNNPQNKLKCIHIAGTNGKGSVTEMMSNILVCSGLKVGKFISPHLINYNERISINNKNISNEELEKYINILKPIIKQYSNTYKKQATLFEIETTIAILYFYNNDCDICVFEVGLGGIYDCTNIINPIVSIINSIGYDHIDILGKTLPEIAFQKAGIIKPNSNTVFFKQEDNVNKVIIDKCTKEKNKLHMLEASQIKNYSFNENYQFFDFKDYKQIKINLKGLKQTYNASLCLEAITLLKSDFEIKEEDIRYGLQTVVHRGRFEKIYNNPTIIYDGGHNLPAIENLLNTINMYYNNSQKIFIISLLKTKDYKAIFNKLINKNNIFIFTDGNNKEKYNSKETLFEEALKYTDNNNLLKMELKDAIKYAKKQNKDIKIFVIGSFYIYGDVLNFLK